MQTSEDFILILLALSGGCIRGKSLLQQKLFFLSNALNVDLEYQRHFYGAYSPEVANAVSRLNSLGFIEQRVSESLPAAGNYELQTIEYSITKDGTRVVQDLKTKYLTVFELAARFVEHLSKITGFDDYVVLSIAAKQMMSMQSTTNTRSSDFADRLRSSGWSVSDQSMEHAFAFMKSVAAIAQEPVIA